jgi:hypothetical protein
LALSVGLCTTQKLLTFVVFAMKVLVWIELDDDGTER